jgi:hypothetical protein
VRTPGTKRYEITGELKKLHNEIRNAYSSLRVIRAIGSGLIRLEGYGHEWDR